jgi:NAD(P)-dependent dehydrogenase (short-subunit alcohol dehydrogenase family)
MPQVGPTDRIALITGSSGGIGRAIALRLARDGARIAVTARTDDRYPGSVLETVAAIREAGGEAEAFECDLSVREQRQRLVSRVATAMGPVDVLVNNAAVSTMVPLAEFPERRFTLMFDVQVRAPLELAQHVLPAMKAAGRGWIVNVSSPAALHPRVPATGTGDEIGRTAVYGMCKAALERFTTGLAGEVYDDGIDVNALAPTYIVPTFGAQAFFDVSRHQAEPPDAMADALAALVDPAAERTTGQILYSQDVLARAGLPTPRLVA